MRWKRQEKEACFLADISFSVRYCASQLELFQLENYEEKTGIAVSLDLIHWQRLTHDGPYVVSPHATGSLRYLHPLELENEWRYYYEYARADGAHEIRMNRFPKH